MKNLDKLLRMIFEAEHEYIESLFRIHRKQNLLAQTTRPSLIEEMNRELEILEHERDKIKEKLDEEIKKIELIQ
jgi:dissimilatory sulfite reductase (desulfoviridin) alpha/beta subunit